MFRQNQSDAALTLRLICVVLVKRLKIALDQVARSSELENQRREIEFLQSKGMNLRYITGLLRQIEEIQPRTFEQSVIR